MTGALFFALPGNEILARRLARLTGGQTGKLSIHVFPDGETLLRLHTRVTARKVVLVCTLDRPNEKLPPLLFAADAARAQGARSVTLVAPYLCYMRQDKAFRTGEAVTSRSVARLISQGFDRLITVDPHLHRYTALAEIYPIPAVALHAAPLLGAWIKRNVARPFLIGPDVESRQWVRQIAQACNAPYIVLRKQRSGDRAVRESVFQLPAGTTPVIVDDTIASGATILETMRLLGRQRAPRPVVLAIHGVFAAGAMRPIQAAAAQLVTTNTIPNPRARIDVSPIIAAAL